ncbi:hypothetical protein P4H70_14975 [Paenibacillus ehimensis]|uniref:hypothetical protein n=1 Tax=Paenibacillus ehimensis TaxID=79264 RepID=UPI002DBE69FF|nr:hypothetical protein [Paenibacillus ehimensis]MEC0210239.1 hypothetical protein [Paenibacillus ehimensis]
MPTFNNLADLFKHINAQTSKALQDEVATTIKQQMHEVIEDVTYEQYTPESYIRTHELSDTKNMEVTVIDNNTIQIINTRHDGDRDVARIVAEGIGYSWQNSAIYRAQPFERNFYEDTINFLKHNGKHINSFKIGMKKRGIEIV